MPICNHENGESQKRQLKVARGFFDNDENLPNITSFSLAYKHEGSLSIR